MNTLYEKEIQEWIYKNLVDKQDQRKYAKAKEMARV